VARDADGKARRMVGTHTDITARKRAEVALRQSEEDYRQLFASMLDGFALHEIICDAAGRPMDYRFLSLNPAFERLTGMRAADVVGRTVMEIMPATEPKWIERYGRVALTGEGVEFEEYSAVLQRHFEIAAFRPKPGQFATVFIDITARKHADAALRESEERYQRITEAITDYIFTVQVKDGRAVDTRHGPGCEAVTGYAAADFSANAGLWLDMVVPEDRPAVEAQAQSILAGRDAPTLEHRLVHKDGSVRWVSNTIVPHRDENHALLSYDGLIHDITARKQAEMALAESQSMLTAIMDSTEDMIWTANPVDFGLMTFNRSFREYFYRNRRLQIKLGDRPQELLPDADYRALWQNFYRRALVAPYSVEYRTSVGGATLMLSFNVLKRDGVVFAISIFGKDITARIKAEATLRASEHNLQEAQKLAGMGSWRVEIGPAGERWSASPELRRIYGNPGDVPLPENFWFEAIHPEDRAMVAAIWTPFLRGEGPGECEHRIVIGGQTKWVLVRAQVRLDPGTGRPVEISGTSQDVTARKLAEADHARLVTAVEQAAETIVITDTNGTILYANPAFEKTTGYTRAEALGRNPRILKSGRQDPRQYREMWECLGRGEVWSGHFINRRKDGGLFEEEATISPVRDSSGRTVNYVAVKRDVSREVLLESQFRQAQKMEAVGQLAGGVAHDFNNILAAVMMHIGLLQLETALDAGTQASLKELGKEIQRGAGLTRQLLAFSRQQQLEPKRLDLHSLVAGLLNMLRRLLGEHIAIDLPAAAGDPHIDADAGMIEQVVINLCINARDAMPQGGRLALRTEAVELAPTDALEPGGARPGRFVRLSVTDTGTGMTTETIQHIFEPFFTTKDKGKGTGLGLATVYGIVQQHRGWVTVDSTPGRGTTFHVHLPVSDTMVRPVVAKETPSPARGRGETILLVEDETSLRSTVAATLRHHGYKVHEAPDGPAALGLWQQEGARIDLVFTDIVMPNGMSGHELIERLVGEKPGLNVIATTGYSSSDPTLLSTVDNSITVLGKPFGPGVLLAAVRARLDHA